MASPEPPRKHTPISAPPAPRPPKEGFWSSTPGMLILAAVGILIIVAWAPVTVAIEHIIAGVS